MNKSDKLTFLDPLYGDVTFSEPLKSLIKLPLVQRLRHVRLSNIDSLASPGISGISRYEHALGVSYLASKTELLHLLTKHESDCFLAAALLHDSAITPFGHLVEEAMQYRGESVSHEEKWSLLLSNGQAQIGGIDLQIYCRRESGLRNWAYKIFGERFEEALGQIFQTIQGKGIHGEFIRGDIDLDNIDNVPRAAFHMGIQMDKRVPLRIAQGMHFRDREILFSEQVVPDLTTWLQLRNDVYNRFMLSDIDFAGKVMLISATISAMNHEIINKEDWKLSDSQFIEKLLSCGVETVRDPIEKWLLGDLWSISKLIWFKGMRPGYSDLSKFSKEIGKEIKRECLSYGIQDKRSRELSIKLYDGTIKILGSNPQKWLLGVGSPQKKPFKTTDNNRIIDLAENQFGCEFLSIISEESTFSFL